MDARGAETTTDTDTDTDTDVGADTGADDEVPEFRRLRLRLGVRVAVVWMLYLLPSALAPESYGKPVIGPVSLGLVLAVVPLAVGLHALVTYGRRADALDNSTGSRGWS